jgi:hypothetical protein
LWPLCAADVVTIIKCVLQSNTIVQIL